MNRQEGGSGTGGNRTVEGGAERTGSRRVDGGPPHSPDLPAGDGQYPLSAPATPRSGDSLTGDDRVISPSPTISLRGISKIYGTILGINNITLNIYPGVTGFLGPNGAGKSTVLRIIAGLIRPSAGTIHIHHRDPRKHPEILAGVGYCPEHDAFYPDMTGKQFVAHFLRIRGFQRIKALRMADLVLRRLDLGDHMDRRIAGYSRGMKQKVKVAASVVHNPETLILDEPLQGADPEARHLLIKNIKGWADQGMTIIVSSHILSEIERMTKRVVLINQGRVYAVGEMDQIRALMANRPLTIRITPRDPARIRDLASLLARQPSVQTETLDETSLSVRTLDAREFSTVIPGLLTSHSIEITELMPLDDNLESLYYYLMTQRRW